MSDRSVHFFHVHFSYDSDNIVIQILKRTSHILKTLIDIMPVHTQIKSRVRPSGL